MRYAHATAMLGLALLLAGCAGDRLSHAEMLRDGWLYSDAVRPAPQLWCYRTLAEPDCHATALDDGGTRLIAAQGLAAR